MQKLLKTDFRNASRSQSKVLKRWCITKSTTWIYFWNIPSTIKNQPAITSTLMYRLRQTSTTHLKLSIWILKFSKTLIAHPFIETLKNWNRTSRNDIEIKVLAFGDAFDMAYFIKCALPDMMTRNFENSMIADSLVLLDVNTKVTMATEKSLIFNLLTTKDSNWDVEFYHQAFIRSEFILVDL